MALVFLCLVGALPRTSCHDALTMSCLLGLLTSKSVELKTQSIQRMHGTVIILEQIGWESQGVFQVNLVTSGCRSGTSEKSRSSWVWDSLLEGNLPR